MLYPNHKIEDIFKLVHKTQDPKDIQWVIYNLGKFNYFENIHYLYKNESYLYPIQCSYNNLISLLIRHGNLTKEQYEFILLFRRASYAVVELNAIKEYLSIDNYLVSGIPIKLSQDLSHSH
jgi:hypothetical protein